MLAAAASSRAVSSASRWLWACARSRPQRQPHAVAADCASERRASARRLRGAAAATRVSAQRVTDAIADDPWRSTSYLHAPTALQRLGPRRSARRRRPRCLRARATHRSGTAAAAHLPSSSSARPSRDAIDEHVLERRGDGRRLITVTPAVRSAGRAAIGGVGRGVRRQPHVRALAKGLHRHHAGQPAQPHPAPAGADARAARTARPETCARSAAGASSASSAPFVQQRDARAALGLVQVRRRHHDGDALRAERRQQLPELAARHRIDAGRRLVEQNRAAARAPACRPARASASCRPTVDRPGRERNGVSCVMSSSRSRRAAYDRSPWISAKNAMFSSMVRSPYRLNRCDRYPTVCVIGPMLRDRIAIQHAHLPRPPSAVRRSAGSSSSFRRRRDR